MGWDVGNLNLSYVLHTFRYLHIGAWPTESLSFATKSLVVLANKIIIPALTYMLLLQVLLEHFILKHRFTCLSKNFFCLT